MKKIDVFESCTKCKHVKIERDYTADSFEFCMSWFCTKSNKFVRRYVDWHDKDEFIPDWCELEDYKK